MSAHLSLKFCHLSLTQSLEHARFSWFFANFWTTLRVYEHKRHFRQLSIWHKLALPTECPAWVPIFALISEYSVRNFINVGPFREDPHMKRLCSCAVSLLHSVNVYNSVLWSLEIDIPQTPKNSPAQRWKHVKCIISTLTRIC